MLTKNFFERSSIIMFPVLAAGLCLFPLSASAQSNRNIERTTQTRPVQSMPIDDFSRTPPFFPTGEDEAQSGPSFGECVQAAVAVCGPSNVESVSYEDGTCSFSCQESNASEPRKSRR